MMKNRIITNSVRSIRRYFPRFLSLMVMSALGVFVFSGLTATAPDMILSLDRYLDEHKGYDIQVISDMGLMTEDVDALKQVEGVCLAEGAYHVDRIAVFEDKENVIRIFSMPVDINTPSLLEGRLPGNPGEIVVEASLLTRCEVGIGDKLVLQADEDESSDQTDENASGAKEGESTGATDLASSDEDKEDSEISFSLEEEESHSGLSQDTFTIVGTVDSSLYYNAGQNHGNTTVGSGKISYYAYVLPEAFDQDYYTTIYLTAEGAESLTTSYDDYKTIAERVCDAIEEIAADREDARYQSIYQEFESKIDDAEAEANEQLADAASELADARQELDDGQAELTDARQQLDDAELELSDAKRELDDASAQLADGKSQLDLSWSQLSSASSTLTSAKAQLEEGRSQLDSTASQLTDATAQLEDSKTLLDEKRIELDAASEVLQSSKEELDAAKEELDSQQLLLDTVKATLEAADTEISLQESALESARQLLETSAPFLTEEQYQASLSEYEANASFVSSARENYNNSFAEYQTNAGLLAAGQAAWEEKNQEYQAGLEAYQAGEEAYAEGLATYEEQYALWEEAMGEYQAGEELYSSKLSEYQNGMTAYQNGMSQYQAGYNTYNSSKQAYEDGLAQYNDGLAEYEQGLSDYEDGLAKYNDGLAEYNEGMAEYEDAEAEVSEKIGEARDRLNDIAHPNWYIYDRSKDSTYKDFIEDAQSISNLASVFPVVFFLVAVLVSLISMNRMVEDDRMEIGTLKSLGYHNGAILVKYLVFSLTATMIGGAVGAALGLYILPTMIFGIYRILFSVPGPVLLFHPATTLLGFFITVLCVCGTSIFTVLQELKEKPSELLRPKAPKNGQRVLLEHIPFIWSRLNFSNKVTVRNLFRYKKRVLVTIGGITGCTALLLCGFGIRDSIVDIPVAQYGEIFHFDGTCYVKGDEPNLDAYFAGTPISSYTPSQRINVNVDTMSAYLFVTKNEADLHQVVNLVEYPSGQPLIIPDHQVVITEKMAATLDIHPGDELTVLDLDQQSFTYKVADIVKNYVENYIFMTADTLQGKEFDPDVIYFQTDHELTEEEQENMSEELLSHDDILNVSYRIDMVKGIDNMLKSLNKVVVILIVLSALLSFVVLYNLANININERKREIATLKVLGFYDKEVDNYITREMYILTAIGIGLGLFLGTFLSRIVVSTIEVDIARFINEIRLSSYIYSALLSILFTAIVNFITHFILAKIPMVESLKSVE